jgi:class 3 adenylate cyclase/tetratricopeptide (TPR) repeat protein
MPAATIRVLDPAVRSYTRSVATRRTVTVVFADVTGSTALGERLDPESLQHVMTGYFAAMRTVLERHGGTVEKFIGDAVMAVFGIPGLHEDDALRAVRAAVEMRTALAALNDKLAQAWGIELAIRIGLNTGEVVARDPSEGQSFAIGNAVNVAQRLEESAAPGEILIGDATFRLVRDDVIAESVGSLALRGKVEGVGAHRLLDVREGARDGTDFETPIVGRERELGLLRDVLELVIRERSCHVCTLVGAPGIGKSRVAREFVDGVSGSAAVAVGRCRSYGETVTYWPLREIVRTLIGAQPREWIKSRFAGEASAVAVAERIATAVGGGEVGAQQEETFWAFRKLFEAIASDRPLVLVIDDVHWAEPTIFDLLDHLIGLSAGAPILLLCLARPDLFENRPEWGMPQPTRTVISLAPLAGSDSKMLMERLRRARDLPEEAQARAIEAAEGNPLFLEQLVAFESEGGRAAMPPTIHALLAARVDRLPSAERAVLERGAIVGRGFERAAVAELLSAAERPKLDLRLLALVRKDFIHPRSAPLQTEDTFAFRHALVRDAAYEAMAKELRAELHERHADWLELSGGEDEIIGYHLEQACRYLTEVAPMGQQRSDLAVRAAERLGSAGRTALKRGDTRGAVKLLARAVSLPPPDASARLRFLPDLGEALSSSGDLAHAGDVLTEAEELAARADDVQTGWRARLQRMWLRFQTDPSIDTQEVLRDVGEAVAEFERHRDDRALGHAWHLIAWLHLNYGRLEALADAVRHGREHAQAAGDAMTDEELAVLALLVGPTGPIPVAEAIAAAEMELERGRASGSRRVESAALLVLAMCAAFGGRFDEARRELAQATAIDEELGGGRGSGFQYTPAGMIELLAGDVVRAERELRIGYETLRERGDAWFLCGVAAELADVVWLQGRDDEALELTLVSEDNVAKEVLVAQMMWRGARAKVLARRGQAEEAEALAREGVAIIERTDYVLYHADALTDLAEVLRLQDRSSEAVTAAEKAWRLYEQKGNAVAARNVQTLLEELRSGIPAGS